MPYTGQFQKLLRMKKIIRVTKEGKVIAKYEEMR